MCVSYSLIEPSISPGAVVLLRYKSEERTEFTDCYVNYNSISGYKLVMVLHLYQTVLFLNCSLAVDLVELACFLVSILVMAFFFCSSIYLLQMIVIGLACTLLMIYMLLF
jgi:hypothetical protein